MGFAADLEAAERGRIREVVVLDPKRRLLIIPGCLDHEVVFVSCKDDLLMFEVTERDRPDLRQAVKNPVTLIDIIVIG